MAIQFADIETAVRIDLSQEASASIDSPTIYRYCRETYHELLHTKADLHSVFNATTGVITDLADTLDDTADSFPDSLDARYVAILALVRAKLTKRFLTSDTQIARFKIDSAEWNEEQGLTKPR